MDRRTVGGKGMKIIKNACSRFLYDRNLEEVCSRLKSEELGSEIAIEGGLL